jgi:DNA-3-methyladenine glycosylase II
MMAPMTEAQIRSAVRKLKSCDPILDRIIRDKGAFAPRRHGDPFAALCRAIISQQISTKVARTIEGRFLSLFPRRRPTATRLLAVEDAELRAVGLSGQKMKYMRDLAAHAVSGALRLSRIGEQDDDDVIASLTRVKGVGVWTAQMFLMFVLGRPDVLPVDDFGLKKAVMIQYGFDELPGAEEIQSVAEPWRPYRSIATWYLWRSLENAP